MEDAVHRRADEELGLQVELRYLYKFQYHAQFSDWGSENELCSVFVGFTDDQPMINRTEIADWRFVAAEELTGLLASDGDRFTPWFHQEWQELLTNHSGLFKAAAGAIKRRA